MRRVLCGLVLAAAAGSAGCGSEVKKSEAELAAEQKAAEQLVNDEEKAYQKSQKAKK
jgi:hypothetical protein